MCVNQTLNGTISGRCVCNAGYTGVACSALECLGTPDKCSGQDNGVCETEYGCVAPRSPCCIPSRRRISVVSWIRSCHVVSSRLRCCRVWSCDAPPLVARTLLRRVCVCNSLFTPPTPAYFDGPDCGSLVSGLRPFNVLGFVGETINDTMIEAWRGDIYPRQYSYFTFNVPTAEYKIDLRVTPNGGAIDGVHVMAAYARIIYQPKMTEVPWRWRDGVFCARRCVACPGFVC